MAFAKGHTKLGGRKPGVVNKRTQHFRKEVAKAGTSPLEHMLAVLHDPKADADRRDRMAIAAAPFVHPKLAVIDSTVRAEVSVSSLTADELRAQARALIAEAFRERPLLIEHEPRVVAGRDIAADVSAQANGEQQDESEG
jgi:hypothetical protein